MARYFQYSIILACLIATFYLYNEQLAAAPLLLLSIFLFFLGYKELSKLKNKK